MYQKQQSNDIKNYEIFLEKKMKNKLKNEIIEKVMESKNWYEIKYDMSISNLLKINEKSSSCIAQTKSNKGPKKGEATTEKKDTATNEFSIMLDKINEFV